MRINGVSSISRSVNVEIPRNNRAFEASDQSLADLEGASVVGVRSQGYGAEKLIDAVEDTNRAFEIYNRRFEVSVHENTGSVMVKVIDTSTDEVIREIPPEKILDMVAVLWEMAGIIVDRKI